MPLEPGVVRQHVLIFRATDAGALTGNATYKFRTDALAPAITLTSPTAGSSLKAITIVGTVIDVPAGVQSLTVKLGGGIAQDVTLVNGAFNFPVSLAGAVDGLQPLTLIAKDIVDNSGNGSDPAGLTIMVTLDRSPPVITVTNPDSVTYYHQTPAAPGTITDTGSGIQTSTIQLDARAADPLTLGAGGQFSYSPAPPALADGDHKYVIVATDRAGNQSTREIPFRVDTTPPTLVVSAAPAGSVSVVPTFTGTAADAFAGLQSLTALVAVEGTNRPLANVTVTAGAFSFTPALDSQADQGLITITFVATDKGGLTTTVVREFTFDTQPPSVTPPPQNSVASASSPLVIQMSESVASLTASFGGASPINVPVAANHTFSIPFAGMPALSDGQHSVVLTATDPAHNVSTRTVSFIFDSSPPQVVIDSPASGGIVAAVPLLQGNIKLSAAGLSSATFTVDSLAAQTLAVDALGDFTAALGNLTDGTHTVVVRATSVGGNVATSSVTFRLDKTAPTLTVTSPTSGSIAATSPAITGTARDTGTGLGSFTLQVDSLAPISVTPGANGAFSVTPANLSAGTHTFLLRAIDAAGNVSSTSLSFTLDTVGPVFSQVTPAEGAVGSGATVQGKVVDALSSPSTLRYQLDGGAAIVVAVAADGSFTFPPSLGGATDGAHLIHMIGTDALGNVATRDLHLTLDTHGPSLSVLSPSLNIVAKTNPTLAGVVLDASSPVASLTARVDGGTAQNIAIGADGSFSFAPALALTGAADGRHTILLEARDALGNASAGGYSFVLDTRLPLISLLTPPNNLVFARNIDVAGTAIDTGGLRYLQASLDDGDPVAPDFDDQGFFSIATNFATDGSADGLHSIIFQAEDLAGNFGELNFVFRLDSSAPVITPPAGGASFRQNPVVAGQVAGLAAIVQLQAAVDQSSYLPVSVDGTGHFTMTPTLPLDGSADGRHVVHFRATDAQNRVGNAEFVFTLDTRVPTITLTSPPANSILSANPDIFGTLADTQPGPLTLTAALDNGSAVSVPLEADRTFLINPGLPVTGSADGVHVVHFIARDAAGNQTALDFSFRLDTSAPKITLASDNHALANDNFSLDGNVISTSSTVASLQAALDGGSFAPISVNATGRFSISTQFAVDGSADGSHIIRLRATDAASRVSTYDFEFLLDTQAPDIQLASPAVGSLVDRSPVLTGKVTDRFAKLDSLKASLDGGTLVDVNVDATGLFQLSAGLAETGAADGLHSIQLQATDRAGNVQAFSIPFFLDTQRPVISVNDFAPGDTIAARAVTGTVVDPSPGAGILKLDIALDSGAFATVPLDQTNSFSYLVELTAAAGSNHILHLRATDLAGHIVTVDLPFVWDPAAPAQPGDAPFADLAFAAPAKLTVYSVTPSPITKTASDRFSMIDEKNVQYDLVVSPFPTPSSPTPPIHGKIPKEDVKHIVPPIAPNRDTIEYTYHFEPAVPSSETTYSLTITAVDSAGNPGIVYALDYIVDTRDPIISLVDPGALSGTVTDLTLIPSSVTAKIDSTDLGPVPLFDSQFYLYDILPDSIEDGRHMLYMTAKDEAGHTTTKEWAIDVSRIPDTVDLSNYLSLITSLAYDPQRARLFVSDYARIYRIDPITASITTTFLMPGGGSSALAIAPAEITLAGALTPAGSLLVVSGGPAADRVYALDPTSGAVLAQLAIPADVNDAVALTYSTTTNSLWLLRGSNELVEINPTSGEVRSRFAAPFDIGYGGLAVIPGVAEVWVASSATNQLARVGLGDGTVLESIDLGSLGLDHNISGLTLLSSFDSRRLLFSVLEGKLFKRILS